MPKQNTFARDTYDTTVFLGGFCAFNQSGEVRKGHISDIRPRKVTSCGKPVTHDWYGNPYSTFFIREQATGKISKVTNPRNLVMLD